MSKAKRRRQANMRAGFVRACEELGFTELNVICPNCGQSMIYPHYVQGLPGETSYWTCAHVFKWGDINTTDWAFKDRVVES